MPDKNENIEFDELNPEITEELLKKQSIEELEHFEKAITFTLSVIEQHKRKWQKTLTLIVKIKGEKS